MIVGPYGYTHKMVWIARTRIGMRVGKGGWMRAKEKLEVYDKGNRDYGKKCAVTR